MTVNILQYEAFSSIPGKGNPAGVVLDGDLPTEAMQVFFVDSLLDQESTAQDSPPLHREGYAERKLNDGRQFRIVKKFYEPAELEARLQELNWYGTVGATQRFFLYGLVRLQQIQAEAPSGNM